MFYRMLRLLRSQAGSAMVSAVLMSGAVVTVGVTTMTIAIHTNDVSVDDRARTQALHAADAGVNEMIERFSADFTNVGVCSATITDPKELSEAGQTVAKYRVRVEGTVSDTNCATNQRLVRSWGYDVDAKVLRQLEVIVEVTPMTGFGYTMFAGGTNGALSLKNDPIIEGGMYAKSVLALWNNVTQTDGGLTSPGTIVTKNGDKFGGDLVAGGDIVLGSKTTVSGGVRSATGDITLGNDCVVVKTIRAGGVVNGECASSGGVVQKSWSSPPVDIPLPSYVYDGNNYLVADSGDPPPPPPVEFTSVDEANEYFKTPLAGLAGAFHITDPSLIPGTVKLTTPWPISGEVTIVTDKLPGQTMAPKIELSGDWTTTTCAGDDPCQFVVASTGTALNQISVGNPKLRMPEHVGALFYTPGGVDVAFQIEYMTGAIYADFITTKNNVVVKASQDLMSNPPPGFTFPQVGIQHWEVQPISWREVPPGDLPEGS